MPAYIVELPYRGGQIVVNDITALTVDAPNPAAAREMAALFSGQDAANWANAYVRRISDKGSLIGWRMPVEVFGTNTLPIIQTAYLCEDETISSALQNIAALLNESPQIDNASVDASTNTLTVTGVADNLGDARVRVGMFPPGAPYLMFQRYGKFGVTEMILEIVDEGDSGDAITVQYVADNTTIPTIPDPGDVGGDPGIDGTDGDGPGTGDTPDDPSVDDGFGGNGEPGNPDPPLFGKDPRQIDGNDGIVLEGWWRADQLVCLMPRGEQPEAVYAWGNMVNTTSNAQLESNRYPSKLIRRDPNFNNKPSIRLYNAEADDLNQLFSTEGQPYDDNYPIHYFIVLMEHTYIENSHILDAGGQNTMGLRRTGPNELRVVHADSSYIEPFETFPDPGNAMLLEAHLRGDNPNGFLRVDGTGTKSQTTSGLASATPGLTIGGSGISGVGTARSDLSVAEVIRFTGAEVKDDNIQDLYDYLRARYNLAIPIA